MEEAEVGLAVDRAKHLHLLDHALERVPEGADEADGHGPLLADLRVLQEEAELQKAAEATREHDGRLDEVVHQLQAGAEDRGEDAVVEVGVRGFDEVEGLDPNSHRKLPSRIQAALDEEALGLVHDPRTAARQHAEAAEGESFTDGVGDRSVDLVQLGGRLGVTRAGEDRHEGRVLHAVVVDVTVPEHAAEAHGLVVHVPREGFPLDHGGSAVGEFERGLIARLGGTLRRRHVSSSTLECPGGRSWLVLRSRVVAGAFREPPARSVNCLNACVWLSNVCIFCIQRAVGQDGV